MRGRMLSSRAQVDTAETRGNELPASETRDERKRKRPPAEGAEDRRAVGRQGKKREKSEEERKEEGRSPRGGKEQRSKGHRRRQKERTRQQRKE
ncbi:unnamed protein product [Lota lota]